MLKSVYLIKWFAVNLFVVVMLSLSACSNAPGRPLSEIPGMIDDGGWIMNTSGKSHTHRVTLAECADKPLLITHAHDDETLGRHHKHKGCFQCPGK
ncbi:MAG: hypothetical protein CR991_08030 [Proteobacteria bacterium]|nr:MAG: hypothetical protein CR991_08030 [Pseudomonadota bacterium]